MPLLTVERLAALSPERRQAILTRSMEDVSDVYAEMREICMDIQKRGDAVAVEHYRKYKEDISPADIQARKEEVEEAYKTVRPEVVEKLRLAARNIEKFHRAQREREMWQIEISEGIVAGRMTRPMDCVGCYVPGGRAARSPGSPAA